MDKQKVQGGQTRTSQQPKGIVSEEVDTYLVALWGKEEPLSTCTGHGLFYGRGKGYSGTKSKNSYKDP